MVLLKRHALGKQCKWYDKELDDLLSQFLKLRYFISTVYEQIVEQYFGTYFLDSSIECDAKARGVQLGYQVNVDFATGKKKKPNAFCRASCF